MNSHVTVYTPPERTKLGPVTFTLGTSADDLKDLVRWSHTKAEDDEPGGRGRITKYELDLPEVGISCFLIHPYGATVDKVTVRFLK